MCLFRCGAFVGRLLLSLSVFVCVYTIYIRLHLLAGGALCASAFNTCKRHFSLYHFSYSASCTCYKNVDDGTGFCVVQRPQQSDQLIPESSTRRVSVSHIRSDNRMNSADMR